MAASISVHIVTYNSVATIAETLSVLNRQTYSDFDTLVIDNASYDDTVQVVESTGCRIVCNTANLGYSAAHNQAIAMTSSDYILTLNPDVILQPDFLEQLANTLDADPALGSASGCLLRINQMADVPRVIDSCGLYLTRSRRQRLWMEGKPVEARPLQRTGILGPDGAAAFYRRDMLMDVAVDGEIFDEDYFMHKEDVDLCWRANLYGWKSVYVPEAVAHHIRFFRPGNRTIIPPDMRMIAVRNRYFLLLKNERFSDFLRHVLWILTYDVGILAYIVLRERSSLRAYWDVIRLWRRMRNKRKKLLVKRSVQRIVFGAPEI